MSVFSPTFYFVTFPITFLCEIHFILIDSNVIYFQIFFPSNVYLFGCIGSSLLCELFSSCGEWSTTLVAVFWFLLLRSTGSRACGWASIVIAHDLNSGGFQALEHRLNSCGAQAQLLHGMWDLPGSEVEPVSPPLAGGFFTTEPQRNLLLLLSRFSCVRLCVTPQTAAHQAPPSLGFFREEYWSGLPLPSPREAFQ